MLRDRNKFLSNPYFNVCISVKIIYVVLQVTVVLFFPAAGNFFHLLIGLKGRIVKVPVDDSTTPPIFGPPTEVIPIGTRK